MAWQVVIALNVVIAACYFAISSVVLLGLVRTRQLASNPLALATAAIFTTCGVHHAHHALHLTSWAGGVHSAHAVTAVRSVFGEWHSVAIDLVGALVAVTYLGLRRNYKALLNTPAMFEDAVRVAAEAQLREIAFTDPLTGVPNRAAYQQCADRLAENEEPVVVLFIDLDGFKGVNDRYGHDAGDRLLRDVAQRLVRDLRPVADVFRIGGDEFVVVAHGRQVAAQELSARAHGVLAEPFPLREGQVTVGASIGLATGLASTGLERLLREADAGMYQIKARRAVVPSPRQDGERLQCFAAMPRPDGGLPGPPCAGAA